MLSTGLLGKSELFTSDEIIQSDVLRTMLDLICSLKHKSQLAGLGVLAGLALTSAETAKKLLSPKLHQASSHPKPIGIWHLAAWPRPDFAWRRRPSVQSCGVSL